MAQSLSSRWLRNGYKEARIDAGNRDPGYLAVAQDAFCNGAPGCPAVRDHLPQDGVIDERHDTISRSGRLITFIRKDKS